MADADLTRASKLDQYSFTDSLEGKDCENDRNETNTRGESASVVIHKPPLGRLPLRARKSTTAIKTRPSSTDRQYCTGNNSTLSLSFSSCSLAGSLPESEASVSSDQLREDVYSTWLTEKNKKIRLAKRMAIARQEENESGLKKMVISCNVCKYNTCSFRSLIHAGGEKGKVKKCFFFVAGTKDEESKHQAKYST